jgi:hypothetical protein
VPTEAASRYQDIFVATAHVGLAARALEDRIRTIARRGSGKPALILALELGEALDQAATFARCHPREGSHVLVAFIQALWGVEPAPELIPLVSEAAAALVSSAKRATDPRVMSQALCALVEAYVGDDRFSEIASILEHARLGKRATKSALTELVRIETAAAGDIRARADRLKRTILGSHLSLIEPTARRTRPAARRPRSRPSRIASVPSTSTTNTPSFAAKRSPRSPVSGHRRCSAGRRAPGRRASSTRSAW